MQKIVQNDKKLFVMLYISGTIHHMIVIYDTDVENDNISRGFFSYFFKFLIFWFNRVVKGQKTVQNDKKFCVSHSMSQKPYVILLSFMLQMCKMIMSPGVFSILKFWFSGLSWCRNGKEFSGLPGGRKGKEWSHNLNLWYICM